MEQLNLAKAAIENAIANGVGSDASNLKNILLDLARSLDSLCDFDDLRNLVQSDGWPEAVFHEEIADEDSESDKQERAENIVKILLPSMEGKKFLDFGCGEGHVVDYVAGFADFSVGYDIFKNPRSRFEWENEGANTLLTTDLDKARRKGPYDIILLYDVLDHAQATTPQEILSLAKSMLDDHGRIYVRTHPWTSRHGGHVYKKINKAFVHLVFTDEELVRLGVEPDHNLKVKAPIDTYKSWLKDSGLKNSINPELDRQEVEAFFKDNPIVRKRILQAFGKEEWTAGCPEWQMSQCFWDYVLEKE